MLMFKDGVTREVKDKYIADFKKRGYVEVKGEPEKTKTDNTDKNKK